MKAHFSIEYKTVWGENLFLVSGGRKFPMKYGDGGIWSVDIDRFTAAMLSDYFYEVNCGGIVTRQEWAHHSRKAEKGADTFLDSWIDRPEGTNPFLRRHSMQIFDKQGYRGAGTAIPVFSLRSENDFGVGEFYDLMKLVDWAASTGQDVIQLLPVNDTTMLHTWADSYPYNPNSTFALHPQYINLQAAGVRKDATFRKLQAEFNSLPYIDYERVNEAKITYLKKLYACARGRKVLESAEYAAFVNKNWHWLLPYAVFSSYRDIAGTPEFSQWGDMAVYSRRKAEKFYSENKKTVDFHCFVQFLLDEQLHVVCDYARSRGVSFKGDIPIGVCRTSVDVWCNPRLFNMDSQCGAPPDAFAADGQNWGFPTYNWKEMAADGYAWWKARLSKMAEYFDAFRIDHILGFFRIWEIPIPHKSGQMGHFSPAMPYSGDEINSLGLPLESLFLEDQRENGYWHPRISAQKSEAFSELEEDAKDRFNALYEDYFYHRHNDFWKYQALRKLPDLLGSTGMLACAEDLGMIPACVSEVLDNQKLLSLEIQRMPKTYGVDFADTSTYSYFSVCASSTHDMQPLRGWWEQEDRELIREFYNDILGRAGEAPSSCPADVVEQIIEMHLDSPSMLAILPLQDWLGMDDGIRNPDPLSERINVPAEPRHYWRYRMHITLEDLLGRKEFNDRLASMIRRSGRGALKLDL